MPATDVYFSCDVETDGAIPGPFSMVSIGLAVCGTRKPGEPFRKVSVDDHTFYAELKPISDSWDPEALAISGLSREELIANGQDPHAAMGALNAWVEATAKKLGGRAVFVAYPLGFDWMFTYWYLMNFHGKSPFGFSGALDMKSIFAARNDVVLGSSTKRSMPKHLFSKRKHTHNALDDAKEQGELFQNLIGWYPPGTVFQTGEPGDR